MVKKQKSKIKVLPFVVIAVVVFSVLLLVSLFERDFKKMDKKVLVLGIDGMDPKMASRMISEGKLPNFEKLYFKNLSTTMTPQSPIAWASLATGKNPGKTNIFDFIRRNPKNYLPVLSLAKTKSTLSGTDYEPYVRGDSFWKLTSESGVPTSVIRWPLTFPADKVSGNLLSGLGVPDIRGFLSGYTYYTESDELKGEDKTVKVESESGVINTVIKGPRKRTSKGVVDVTVPMEIEIGAAAKFNVNGQEFTVEENSWTPWIEMEFKVGFAKKMSGIARGYLISLNPFRMYLSDVQIDPNDPEWKISHPKDYSKELVSEVGLFNTLGMAEDTGAYEEDAITREIFLEQVNDIEEERTKIFWKEFEVFQENGGLYAYVFDESDRLQHMFYGKEDQVIEDYYIGKDKFLGEVLDKIDSDTNVLVISDHGITNYTRSVELNAWLVSEGYLVLKEDKNIPLFKDVDWSQSKAYSIGFSGIYLNVEGREGEGIVAESDKDDLMNEIISKLKTLKDGGEDVVFNAYKSEDIYSGPYVSDSPDIVVGFYPGYRAGWESPIGGTPKKIFSDNNKKWGADHIVDASFVPGSIFTNFEFEKEFVENVDVFPTVLTLLGVDVPSDIDGESLI